MSRIGKKPIAVPAGVSVELAGRTVRVSGPKGKLQWSRPAEIAVQYDSDERMIRVSRGADAPRLRALHGLTRALIANMVEGVSQGFEKRLEIHGVGYNARLQDRKLLLNLGYSGRGQGRAAQFEIEVPADLTVEVTAATNPARISIRGADKQRVGQFAAEIRRLRPPEPYQGKGIRYEGEQVRRKAGKAFAGGAR